MVVTLLQRPTRGMRLLGGCDLCRRVYRAAESAALLRSPRLM